MKIKYFVVAVAACAVQGVNAASTADYVQDGLMEFWDGINNTGNGTHDPNATVWKSLVSGGQDLTIDAGVWTDGNCLSNDALRAAYASNNKKVAYVTGEFAIRNDQPTGGNLFVFMAGQPDEFRRVLVLSEGHTKFYDRVVNGSTTESGRFAAATSKTTGFHTYSVAVRGAAYMDGVQKPVLDEKTGWGAGSGLYLGSNGNANRIFHGRYYSIRLYDRALTADEAKRNSIVDNVRFQGIYADGYRASPADGSLQQRFRVAAPTGGTVAVDAEPLAADFEEWTAIGTEATHTLTATAAEGYVFQRWEGDTDKIVSGTFASDTITVTSPLAVSITPVFTAKPVSSMAEPVVTINVDSGTTVLDDWLAANPDVAIGATGTIVKEGAGTLQVTNDLISAFAGEFVIKAGRWLADTRTALGAGSGGDVWVEDGATLHLRATESSETSSQTIVRKVYIKGTGWNGNGALYASNIKGYNANTQYEYLWPKYVTLLGNAKWGINSHINLRGLYVDMNRYTLTLQPDVDWTYFTGGCWSNGNITVTGTTVLMQGAVLRGGSECMLRFTGSSGYCAFNNFSDEGNPSALWKQEYANGASIYARGGTSGWSGPVVLEGDTKVTSQNTWTWIYYWGPISGPGNIGKTSNPGTSWSYTSRGVTIKLANATNSFTGGIWLKYNILDAAVDGAVPANGGAVNSNNSTIKLTKATEYHLPDLALSGTGSVYSVAGATGSFKNATKTGEDLITWDTKVGAKSFALNGGTLKFGANSRTSDTVDVDFGCFSAARGTTLDLDGKAWACTNLTGAATLPGGSLTVNGPWTLDAANAGTLGGASATVTFGPDTELTLANAAGFDRSTVYTIATSATEFTEKLPLSEASRRKTKWHVRLSSDRRSQELFYSSGLSVIFR